MKWTAYVRELVRALAVLAVLFLNFAVTPVATAAGYADDSSSWCGAPADGDETGHFTCAACRIDTAIEPPSRWPLATPVAIVLDRTAPLSITTPRSRAITPPPARGPPSV